MIMVAYLFSWCQITNVEKYNYMILPLLSYEEVIGSENDNSLKEVLWCSAVIILI